MLGSLLIWASPLGLAPFAVAGEAELRVVPGTLRQDQVGAVQVIVRGDRPTAPPKVPISPEGGLELRYDRQGQQVQIVNGVVSRQYEFVYRVVAIEPGEYTIGPADVEVGTTRFQTDVGRIRVEARGEAAARTTTVEAGFGVDEGWVGQVVLYRRKSQSRQRILRDVWSELPLDGLRAPRDGEVEYREYFLADPEGRIHVKEELHPKILAEAGVRDVPAAVARLTVSSPDGRLDPFSLGRTDTEVFATPPAQIEVRELPHAPPGFTGLVGDFQFVLSLDQRTAGVGESVNLTVDVRGDGTLEGFELPDLGEIPGARVYANSPAVAARVDGDVYRSEGRFSRVVVPTRQGELRVPALALVTFSPSRGAYVDHRLDVPPILVTPGKGKVEGEFQSYTDTDAPEGELVESPYEGVRDIHQSGWAYAPWMGAFLPWALGLAAAPLAALGAMESWRWGQRTWATWASRRKRRPPSPADRLRVRPADRDQQLAACDAAIREALALVAGVEVASLDREAALRALPQDLEEEARRLTRRLDRARFGDQVGDDGWAETVSLVERILRTRGRAP